MRGSKNVCAAMTSLNALAISADNEEKPNLSAIDTMAGQARSIYSRQLSLFRPQLIKELNTSLHVRVHILAAWNSGVAE